MGKEFWLFLVLAVIVEGLVEYAKNIVQMKDKKSVALQTTALCVAVALSVLTGADLFGELGISFRVPYVGSILTGIFASRGANYASDLLGRLTKGIKEG